MSKKREKCGDSWDTSGHHGTPRWWFYPLNGRGEACHVIEFPRNQNWRELRLDFATNGLEPLEGSCHSFDMHLRALWMKATGHTLNVSHSFHLPDICRTCIFYYKGAQTEAKLNLLKTNIKQFCLSFDVKSCFFNLNLINRNSEKTRPFSPKCELLTWYPSKIYPVQSFPLLSFTPV